MKKSLLSVYFQNYKPYVIGTALFLVAFIVCFLAIFPQWNIVQTKQQEIDQKKHTIETLKESIQTVNVLTAGNIKDSLLLVNTAIPTGKDIVAIYHAIFSIAALSDVSIKNFSLKIGDLYIGSIASAPDLGAVSKGIGGSTAMPSTAAAANTGGTTAANKGESPTIDVLLDTEASESSKLYEFSNNLYKVLPLAEVDTIAISKNAGKFDVNFYYKPNSSATGAHDASFHSLTSKQKNLLSSLQSWQDQMKQSSEPTLPPISLTPSPIASATATPTSKLAITVTPTVSH